MQRLNIVLLSLCLLFSVTALAQTKDAPAIEPVTGLFLGVQAIYGHISYKNTSLINGFSATSVDQSDFGFRPVMGWNFNQHLGTEFGVVFFSHIVFKGVGIPSRSHSIYHNLVYLVGKYRFPIGQRFAFDIRGGVGYISRKGINVGSLIALKADEFFVPVYGLNVSYNFNRHWTGQLTWMGAPSRSKHKLPASNMLGMGFIYRFGNVFSTTN